MGNKEMIEHLKRIGYLKTKSVENSLLAVDRALFVPEKYKELSYTERALPIGDGATISAPSIVAFMLEKMEIEKGMKVLEIGTGSGYNAALIAELTGEKGRVITVEKNNEVLEYAKGNIAKLGKKYKIEFVYGDGTLGYEKEAPYDRVMVTAALPSLKEDHPLIKQLKKDGKLIAPVGSFYQNLVVYDKKKNRFESVLPVMFVPLRGKEGFKE
ncbi:protein-L-isoaspartate(D-aspartate) O-methyltransferase [Candidatus Micrarchaeota archaeon]|nr:protein-L-isoaspartate(D-aspartate) O-methyltransferase [Candidatus Micrarchaeota archaeon]